MELNSDDVKEISGLRGIKPWIYFYGRERLLAAASVFVSVSDEIRDLYEDLKTDYYHRKRVQLQRTRA
jgi:hypothetical protein